MIDGYILDITDNTITIKKDFVRVVDTEVCQINDTEIFLHEILDLNVIDFFKNCIIEKTKISMTMSGKTLKSIGILIHNKYFEVFCLHK